MANKKRAIGREGQVQSSLQLQNDDTTYVVRWGLIQKLKTRWAYVQMYSWVPPQWNKFGLRAEQRPEKQPDGDGRAGLIMQPSHLRRQIIHLRIKATNEAMQILMIKDVQLVL